MDRQSFRASLNDKGPPPGLSPALQGLWHAAKGDWNKAHDCAQQQEDPEGSWVHAHLHRQEGDLANAGYWYRRAGKPTASQSIEAEWNAIADALLPAPG
ncbi:MAG: hypothetical protein ACJ8FY_24725 [Gemmataceae bacterium]